MPKNAQLAQSLARRLQKQAGQDDDFKDLFRNVVLTEVRDPVQGQFDRKFGDLLGILSGASDEQRLMIGELVVLMSDMIEQLKEAHDSAEKRANTARGGLKSAVTSAISQVPDYRGELKSLQGAVESLRKALSKPVDLAPVLEAVRGLEQQEMTVDIQPILDAIPKPEEKPDEWEFEIERNEFNDRIERVVARRV